MNEKKLVPEIFSTPEIAPEKLLVSPMVFAMVKFLLALWKAEDSWELPMTTLFLAEKGKHDTVGSELVKFGDESSIQAFQYLRDNGFITVSGPTFLFLFDRRIVSPTVKLLQFYNRN